MGHPVKRTDSLPLPTANVIYSPPNEVLFIENGEPSVVSDTIAEQVVAFYDRDADDARTRVVAIRIDWAEWVLKPFVYAVLTRNGVEPESDPELENRMIRRIRKTTAPGKANPVEVEMEPVYLPNVAYNPQSQVLLIESGEPCAGGEEIARGVLVFYDKDADDARTTAVAIRIDDAERVLKPFVDAILAKYGIQPDQQPVANETKP
jgi:hypothetical protein